MSVPLMMTLTTKNIFCCILDHPRRGLPGTQPTASTAVTNSTDPTKTSGRSIRQEQVTCLQVDSWAVIEGMTEAGTRAWLAD